ncbi:MAG TPA: M48 family metalloprotease [Chitinophagaceae bacterium]|nr:M48 family metalloprotease [Chitinophagaceae bacterium]
MSRPVSTGLNFMICTPFTKKVLSLFFLTALVVYNNKVKAQETIYSYQDLSHVAYAKQRDSLKKAWVCPTLYSDKATQKKYKELWDNRTEFITTAISNKNYVYEKEVADYLNAIITDMAKGNPKLVDKKPLILLDRSAAVNAYAVGSNLIAINLGLIHFAESREEIALIIAHELAHNILQHPENSIKEKAEWLTSDAYKNSVNAVLDSKYERFSRLKKVMEGYSFNRSKHNRYHESDADSLAIVLVKNSKIGFDARFFLRLDSSDMQYKQELKKPVKDYFVTYNLAFEDWWTVRKTKGLSTRNYNFKDTTGLQDSLKTHPDCVVRYTNSVKHSDAGLTLTPIPAAIKEKTSRIIIWNLFDNLNLTACLYRVLLEKDNGNKDAWYDFMLHNVIAGLDYSDKQLNRFNAIGIMPKEYISKNYYELQNMLEQIPKGSLEHYFTSFQRLDFWQNVSTDAKALKTLMLSLNAADNDDKKALAAKTFITNNNASMYCEFADHFKK